MHNLKMKMVSPLAQFLDEKIDGSGLAPRPATLDGLRLGLLPNWRPAAISILNAVAALLQQRYRLKAVVMEPRAPLNEVPSNEKLDDLARRFDVILAGCGDCGGCTTWCSQVPPALEKRGVPTVAIITDAFAKFGRRMASTRGCPYIVIAETPEPITGLPNDEMDRRAEAMIQAVIDGYTLQPAELEVRLKDIVAQQLRPQGVVRSSVPM